MDRAIETVLRQYDQGAADEMKQLQELPAGEFAKRIDEFLLAVGPATGQLMNLLIKESEGAHHPLAGHLARLLDGMGSPKPPARPAARSSPWMSTPANSSTRAGR